MEYSRIREFEVLLKNDMEERDTILFLDNI